jgi:electron transport complex protein RnfB
MNRRKFLKTSCQCVTGAVLLGSAGVLLSKSGKMKYVQIDPEVCIACGKCQTACVLDSSAVRCINKYDECGYCEYCFGYFSEYKDGKGKKLCPVDAIERREVKPGEFEYTVDDEKCIACGRCIQRCVELGNGSLRLQVKYDYCKECNQCAIALQCPVKAIKRREKADDDNV